MSKYQKKSQHHYFDKVTLKPLKSLTVQPEKKDETRKRSDDPDIQRRDLQNSSSVFVDSFRK